MKAQLGDLARKESMLLQYFLVPLLRIAPLFLELGDDILVGVRVELGMLKKHTEDSAPATVESTSDPT